MSALGRYRARGAHAGPPHLPRPTVSARGRSLSGGPAGPAPLCPPGGPSVRGSVGVPPGRPAPALPPTGCGGTRACPTFRGGRRGEASPWPRSPSPPPPSPLRPPRLPLSRAVGSGSAHLAGEEVPAWPRERWVLSVPPDIRGRGCSTVSASRRGSHLGGAGLLHRGFPSAGLVPLAREHVRKAGPAGGVGLAAGIRPEGRWQLEK